MKAKHLPVLPSSVSSPTGPIPVEYVAELKTSDGETVMGFWDPFRRCIQIRSGLPKATAWLTLRHEWIHAVLWHAGAAVPDEIEERVCDVIATAMVAEMLGR